MIQPKLISENDIDVWSELERTPSDFADTIFHVFTQNIADDYTYIVQKFVLPNLQALDGLKLRELKILASLAFFKSAQTPARISDLLRYDPATVTRAVERLVRAGKMERIPNPDDVRSIHLKLTEDGKGLVENYAETVNSVFAELEDHISHDFDASEKTVLLNAMMKIRNRAEAMRVMSKRLKLD